MNTSYPELSAKSVAKLMREAKRSNPGLMSAIRKLSDRQLSALEYELLEDEIRQLRHKRGFRSNSELQFLAAKLEYSLRNLEAIELWSNWKPPRKQIKRWTEPVQETPLAPFNPLPATFAEVVNPFEPIKFDADISVPTPVVDNFYSKFFHNRRAEDDSVW